MERDWLPDLSLLSKKQYISKKKKNVVWLYYQNDLEGKHLGKTCHTGTSRADSTLKLLHSCPNSSHFRSWETHTSLLDGLFHQPLFCFQTKVLMLSLKQVQKCPRVSSQYHLLGKWLPAGQLDNFPGKEVTYRPQSQFCEWANWAVHLSNQVKSAQRKMMMTGQRSQGICKWILHRWISRVWKILHIIRGLWICELPHTNPPA